MVQLTDQATAKTALRLRIEQLGSRMRAEFSAILQELTNLSIRPADLGRLLQIDKTLAARLLRSVRADNPLATAREAPAPQGLRLFLDAAARAGAHPEKIAAGHAVVQDFVALLDSLPLGRSSFDTAVDGWLPDSGARAERAAKQSLFKATAQMLGYTIEFMSSTTIIQPSSSGNSCDSIKILLKEGMCRLRSGLPILFFTSYNSPIDPAKAAKAEAASQIIESIDGEREITDARKLLLPDIGDGQSIPLRLFEHQNITRFILDGNVPPVNEPITAALCHLTRNAFLRYREGERQTDALFTLPRVPARVLMIDLLLRDDIYPDYVPNMVPRLHGMNVDPIGRMDELIELDRVETTVEVVRLGTGVDRVGVREFAMYQPMLRDVFRRAGWDPSRFRVYRCRIQYPMPFVSLTSWFNLPERPVQSPHQAAAAGQ